MALPKIVPTAACPYCYHRIGTRTPKYRCNGRAAPGLVDCVPGPDQQRINVLKDATPVLPSFARPRSLTNRDGAICPHCKGPTGTKVCSACHSVLPPSFDTGSPMFGVVGVKGAGKTVMLTVLAQELRSTVARQFGASIHDVGNSKLMARMGVWHSAMSSGGELPPSTPQYRAGETVPAVIEWRYTRKRLGVVDQDAATVLSFYDASGEDLQSDDLARSQHYLAAADGLILLIDPFGFPANRQRAANRGVPADEIGLDPLQVIRSLTAMIRDADRVRGTKLVKRPLAVVVSKIDAFFDTLPDDHPVRRPSPSAPAFDETDSLDLHNHVEAMIHDWGGDDFLAHLRLNYATYRLFAASALGAEPSYRDRQVDSQGIRPHRVAEPLLWQMAICGFIPTARS